MNQCWNCPHHRRELMLTADGRPLCFVSLCCDAYCSMPPGVHRRADHKKPAVLAGLCAGDSRLITT